MVLQLLGSLFKTVWKFVLLLGLVAGALVLLSDGITQTELEEFRLTGLSDISSQSFSFNGELAFDNPSSLPVPLDSVEYAMYLEETGERVSNGSIDSFVLNPGVSRSRFSKRVEWVPSAQLAAQFATGEQVWVTVNGTAAIDLPFVRRHEIPFEDRMDLKRYFLRANPVQESAGATDDSRDASLPDARQDSLI